MRTILNKNIKHPLGTIIPVLTTLLIALIMLGCDDTPTEVEKYDPEPVLIGFIESFINTLPRIFRAR